MTKRGMVQSLFSTVALFGIALVLWPRDAFAWGPLAHLNFSQSALSDLSALSPALRMILSNFASEFLYGSLAADIIVGKNLARYDVHCHNWKVGFGVLDKARSDAQVALSLGFLSHLAADTVAHNYYVPYKTVEGFRARGSGHAYWELRYDQRLPANLWELARHVSKARFRSHDDFLQERLSESYVVPFTLSRSLFGGLLLAARLKKWQRMSEVIAAERDLLLHPEEVGDSRNLAVGNIRDMLQRREHASCVQVDPTGERNLSMANKLRRQLKRRDDLTAHQQSEILRAVRPAFKSGIYGRLRLPEFPDVDLSEDPSPEATAA